MEAAFLTAEGLEVRLGSSHGRDGLLLGGTACWAARVALAGRSEEEARRRAEEELGAEAAEAVAEVLASLWEDCGPDPAAALGTPRAEAFARAWDLRAVREAFDRIGLRDRMAYEDALAALGEHYLVRPVMES